MNPDELSKAELKELRINGKSAWTPYLPVSDTMMGRISRLNSGLEDTEIEMPIEAGKIEEHRAVLNEKNHNHVTKLKNSSRDSDYIKDLGDRIISGELTDMDSITLSYVGMSKKYKSGLTLEDRKKLVVAGEESGADAFVLTATKTTSADKILSDLEELRNIEELKDSDMKLAPTIDLTLLEPSAVRKIVKRLQEKYSQEELPIIAFEAIYPSKHETKITNFTEMVDRHVMAVDPDQKLTLGSREDEVGGRARLSHAFAHLGVDITSNYLHTTPFSPDKPDDPVNEKRWILEKNEPFYQHKSLAETESNFPEEIPFSAISEFEDAFDFVDLNNLNNEATDLKQFEELRDRLRSDGAVGYLENKPKVRRMLENIRS